MTALTIFRVHFRSGELPVDVPAETADQARKLAAKARPDAVVKKIKVVKE